LIEQTERGLLERRGLLMDWEKEVSGREAAVKEKERQLKEKERQLMQVEALLIEKNGLLEDLASRDEGTVAKEPGVRKELV